MYIIEKCMHVIQEWWGMSSCSVTFLYTDLFICHMWIQDAYSSKLSWLSAWCYAQVLELWWRRSTNICWAISNGVRTWHLLIFTVEFPSVRVYIIGSSMLFYNNNNGLWLQYVCIMIKYYLDGKARASWECQYSCNPHDLRPMQVYCCSTTIKTNTSPKKKYDAGIEKIIFCFPKTIFITISKMNKLWRIIQSQKLSNITGMGTFIFMPKCFYAWWCYKWVHGRWCEWWGGVVMVGHLFLHNKQV